MSKFPFAYCEKTGEFVEPEEIADMYLQERDLPRLQCPDELCRKDKPGTEITPVCCNPDKPCKNMSPHFRTHVKHEHSEHCPYEDLKKNTEYILSHKKLYKAFSPESNLLRSLKGVQDTSFLPDLYVSEFKPTSEVDAIHREAQKYVRSGTTKNEAYRIARCCVPHTTSRLSLVIDMAEALDATNERDIVPLSLPGRAKATYESAFLSIYSLRHDYTTPYILCAGAKVHSLCGGFMLNYVNPLQRYHPSFPDIYAVTPLARDGLKPLLIRELEHYAETEETCFVYSLSTHCLKENTCPDAALNCCVVIAPITSGSIVIRERCLKRSQKSNR